MYYTYKITALNLTNNRQIYDSFYSKSERQAINDFFDCYRHGDYHIISIERE